MTDPKKPSPPAPKTHLSEKTVARQAEKDARLAEQLRANLRKRKNQKRLRGEGADEAATVLKKDA